MDSLHQSFQTPAPVLLLSLQTRPPVSTMVKQATSEGVAPAAPAPATRSSNPAVATGGAPKFPTVVKFIRIAQLVLGIVVLGLTAYRMYPRKDGY